MKLSTISLTGYRNFKQAKINFNEKTLIIGANDVGKTNLIWAVRLLLDRGLSDYDIEPRDSDFYAFEKTNHFKILLSFEDVIEDCVVSKMKGRISDDDKLCLAYEGYRDEQTKAKTYKLFAGPSEDDLEEIEDRYYRKVLNLKYIGSRRDFNNYISKEKSHLFQLAKDARTEEQASDDDKLFGEIQGSLKEIDEKIPSLNFVSSATKSINTELSKLSLHHGRQEVVFEASTSDANNFINGSSISSKSNDQSVLIGGDGRLNQIYLALWASKNQLSNHSLSEVTLFCIEEPEAHLHPHQQRKLAEYLNSSISGQVFITSHSPQIAAEFSPNSIVRLFNRKSETIAASDGCSDIIDSAFKDFGYRLSIIPAEAFFSDVVLLVEGPSEEQFYNTLAKQLSIDIDMYNISIMSVSGVGFKTFIEILDSLNIMWVLRTDNDITKVPRKEEYIYSGVKRCISFYKGYYEQDPETEALLLEHEANLILSESAVPTKESIKSSRILIADLEGYNMFVANKDLENDLISSPVFTDLKDFFGYSDTQDLLNKMQSKKATGMYRFLKEKKESLTKLKGDKLSNPLIQCKNIATNLQ